jgi:hypothetical protein
LSGDELRRRKAAFAHALAVDVAARATALVGAWEPTGFLAELDRAGRGSTLFTTQKAAIDAIAAALFELDEVKDRKLAIPLGLIECPIDSCTSTPESAWAGAGKSHLADNARGLRVLLEGAAPASTGSPLGYDDYLDALGMSSLVSELRADLGALDAAIAALPEAPLAVTLAADAPAVRRVYDAAKEVNDFLKLELTIALSITPPARVQGDTD